jgi:hypothetical protein
MSGVDKIYLFTIFPPSCARILEVMVSFMIEVQNFYIAIEFRMFEIGIASKLG